MYANPADLPPVVAPGQRSGRPQAIRSHARLPYPPYNQGMSDDPQDNDRPSRARLSAWRIVAPLVLVPIIYVLSAGPSVWLFHSGWLSEPWADILADIYYPITLAEQKLPVAGPALAAYLEWWKPARPNNKPSPPIPRHKFGPLPARKAQKSSLEEN